MFFLKLVYTTKQPAAGVLQLVYSRKHRLGLSYNKEHIDTFITVNTVCPVKSTEL